MIKYPLCFLSIGQNLMKCALGCSSSKENMVKCSKGCSFSGQNVMQWALMAALELEKNMTVHSRAPFHWRQYDTVPYMLERKMFDSND